MKTEIGDNCLLMIGVHVAHDCIIGNNIIMSNNATLAGHVTVGDNSILGGMSAYHQFIRIGHNAIIGGGSMVAEDVIPYGNVKGDRAYLNGLNIIGMKRNNLDRETINALKDAFKRIFLDDDTTFETRIKEVAKNYGNHNKVLEITDFLTKDPTKSVCMPKFKVVL
jgi:UDP-N-acetylglucosamine acyltransferase